MVSIWGIRAISLGLSSGRYMPRNPRTVGFLRGYGLNLHTHWLTCWYKHRRIRGAAYNCPRKFMYNTL